MSIAKKVINDYLTPEEFYSNITTTEEIKMNISRQVVILSATKNGDSVENTNFRTKTLRGILGDLRLPFSEATGVYKGQTETSFVVVISDNFDIDTLKAVAFKNFDQESILVQDANQEAYLIFNDGTTQNLGRLEQVSEEQARKLDNYTILNNNFYAISNPSRIA
jgi:lipopolysaccharide export LptBFGC system permease protein LptF